jgi:two-component SAPR family response regulator
MLLEDMLSELGYAVVAMAGNLSEACDLARSSALDIAILDVNLDGQEIFPVADILVKRAMPFVFVTGYGEGSLPEAYRGHPTLQKPFQAERLEKTLASLLAPV